MAWIDPVTKADRSPIPCPYCGGDCYAMHESHDTGVGVMVVQTGPYFCEPPDGCSACQIVPYRLYGEQRAQLKPWERKTGFYRGSVLGPHSLYTDWDSLRWYAAGHPVNRHFGAP